MKAQELQRLNQELQQVGKEFRQHLEAEVNQMVTNNCNAFNTDFDQLQKRLVHRLDESLETFSVAEAYGRATMSHRRNATAPLIAVLVEALYYLANHLEDTLVQSTQEVVANFFRRLIERVCKSEYYRKLNRLLGHDSGIEQQLKMLEQQVSHTLVNAARIECDRFVRESPRFYDEGIFSISKFHQKLLQTSQGYDCESIVKAEQAIRQLLKLDFEPKVDATIRRTFRQTINNTLKIQLLPAADAQADEILQQFPQARVYLEQTLEQEAEEKIAKNRQLQGGVEQKITVYDQAVTAINSCLQAMQLSDNQLPIIAQFDVPPIFPHPEVVNNGTNGNSVVALNGRTLAI